MYKPTKKSLYILIACILFLTSIVVVKNQTTETPGLVALETSSSTISENLSADELDFISGQANNDRPVLTDYTEGGANLTEDFSKGLFAKYYTTNSGEELSADDSQALVNQALESYKSIDLGSAPSFAFQDLKIVKSNEQNLRDFANTFATKEEICVGDLQKIAKTTEDPVKTGNQYKKCANEFIQIPITQEINQAYLTLVNSYYLIGEKIYALGDAKADPLKALILMRDVGTLNEEKLASYQKISDFLKKSGIIFGKDEPGGAWVGKAQ
jgi:hypothetical protein